LTCLAIFLLLMALCPAGAPAGEEVTIDGVVHVKNGAEPSEGVETFKLEELWRVGGEDDEEVMLGVVVQAVSDDAGNVYLLDMQLAQVLVISPDGEMTGTLSRQGEGPGEVQRPADLLFMPDGTLGILQTFPGKLIKVTLDDEPAGVVTVGGDPTQGGFAVVVDAKCRGGNLVMAGVDLTSGETQTQQVRTSYLASYTDEGSKKQVYWDKALLIDYANLRLKEAEQYDIFPRRWALGPTGDVYAAVEREQALLNVYAADGALKRVIEREFTNRKRTAEEREFREELAAVQTRQLPNAEVTIAETPEAISYVEVAPDGMIWTVNSRGDHEQPEGIMMTYDVFDPAGHFVKQVRVECDGDGKNDGLIRIGQDRMILIRGLIPAVMAMQAGGASLGSGEEEAEPMEVICYRVKS
jgi:hypothetical protein